MYLNDVTKQDLIGKQIVVVQLGFKNYLTFLVTDCETPQVPGFPACSLTYYTSFEDAMVAIENKYCQLEYLPNNLGYLTLYGRK